MTSAGISRRLGTAHQAFTQHRRVLYRNPRIPWKKRQDSCSTLVLSKHGFESWTFETQKSRDQLHAHMTDDAIIIASGLPSPTELLRSCRLRYFGTLHRCGYAAHWGLLVEDAAWIAMIKDDCRWLWQQLHHSTSLPDPTSHFPVWRDILLHHGGYWKKLIKKGIAHACLQRENEAIAVPAAQQSCMYFTPTWLGHRSTQPSIRH